LTHRRACTACLLFTALALFAAACAPQLRPMGPATTTPALGGDHLVAADGVKLPLRVWRPDGVTKSVIVAVHGFNDYAGAFALPAPFWAARGIATYAYDQRGFGDAPDRGYWAGTATLASDLRAAVAAIRARHPGLALHVVGVSMGGALAMSALADGGLPGVSGVVLVAPAVWGRAHMNLFERGALWLAANTVPWLPLTIEGIGIRPSDNIPMLRELARDPKAIHKTRVDAVKGLVDLMDTAFAAAPALGRNPLARNRTGHALTESASLPTPVLMLYGLRDELVPENPSFAVMRSLAGNPRARRALYKNGHHMLLRDLAAKIVWRDIAAWIADAAAPLPSGAGARADRLLAP
jgi:alpha-beta hydrolase superfamily lysophospholipase